jgi:hypothetical protein
MLKFTKEDKVKIIDPKSDLVNILDADGWVFEEDPKTKPEGKKAKKVKKSKNNG